MSHSRTALALLAVLLGTGAAAAQVKEPPRAEKLDVQIRFRIRANREERIRQYLALEKHLASLGFVDARKNDPDHERDILDPTAERFTGTIPSKNVLHLLDDSHVLNILFAPADYPFPDSGNKPVPIRVIIRDGLLPTQQQLLRGQVIDQLELLGFKDALGYDTARLYANQGSITVQEPSQAREGPPRRTERLVLHRYADGPVAPTVRRSKPASMGGSDAAQRSAAAIRSG